MKNEIDKLNATPSKRIYQSIIADYDLNRAICELVDNGIDIWVRNGKTKNITIKIIIDDAQQAISVEDDAGGVKKEELSYLVGPGQTGTNASDETIGIFGVGVKRAVVALAQDIKIKTHFKKQGTYQIDVDDNWLENDDWDIPVYEVDKIAQGSTIVELQRLRVHVTGNEIKQLIDHLSTTYAKFIINGQINIIVNGQKVEPKFFENWAYPPGYEPINYSGTLKTEDGFKINVNAYAGLTCESSPAAGEYGVYFYCNDRLITRAMKTFDVGFTKGFAGLPHPKVSLTRVLVFLNGEARCMPWNSSKSDINTKHVVFLAIHNWLVQVVKDYASLSRRWMGEWPDKVFKYQTGQIKNIKILDFPNAKKSFLPPLPKTRPRYGDVISHKNKTIANQKPWTRGLYEGIVATDIIGRQQILEQRNRIALILLDSTLEIAFKEYLVNESGKHYNDGELIKIFSQRHLVHDEVKKYITTIDAGTWGKIKFYNNLRNKFVHERATVGISDSDIRVFREVVEKVLNRLYKLRF